MTVFSVDVRDTMNKSFFLLVGSLVVLEPVFAVETIYPGANYPNYEGVSVGPMYRPAGEGFVNPGYAAPAYNHPSFTDYGNTGRDWGTGSIYRPMDQSPPQAAHGVRPPYSQRPHYVEPNRAYQPYPRPSYQESYGGFSGYPLNPLGSGNTRSNNAYPELLGYPAMPYSESARGPSYVQPPVYAQPRSSFPNAQYSPQRMPPEYLRPQEVPPWSEPSSRLSGVTAPQYSQPSPFLGDTGAAQEPYRAESNTPVNTDWWQEQDTRLGNVQHPLIPFEQDVRRLDGAASTYNPPSPEGGFRPWTEEERVELVGGQVPFTRPQYAHPQIQRISPSASEYIALPPPIEPLPTSPNKANKVGVSNAVVDQRMRDAAEQFEQRMADQFVPSAEPQKAKGSLAESMGAYVRPRGDQVPSSTPDMNLGQNPLPQDTLTDPVHSFWSIPVTPVISPLIVWDALPLVNAPVVIPPLIKPVAPKSKLKAESEINHEVEREEKDIPIAEPTPVSQDNSEQEATVEDDLKPSLGQGKQAAPRMERKSVEEAVSPNQDLVPVIAPVAPKERLLSVPSASKEQQNPPIPDEIADPKVIEVVPATGLSKPSPSKASPPRESRVTEDITQTALEPKLPPSVTETSASEHVPNSFLVPLQDSLKQVDK